MVKGYDLIIIGSGPAGLAAAIYAQRARLHTLVLEKEMMSGGQVLNTYEVDNYPGLPGINGFDLGMKLRQHADGLEAKFVQDEVQQILLERESREQTEASRPSKGAEMLQAAELKPEEEKADGTVWKRIVGKKEDYLAKTVIIASGATHKKLSVPGEEELSGRGISYCATCDGAFFKKKVTAVVGGGDVALEDAIFLSRMCSHVYLIHRRDELRGAKTLQEKVFALENVTVIWDSVVEEIVGEQQVQGLSLKNAKTGARSRLDVDGVFIAVGITPNSQAFAGLLEMDHGYIRADENGETRVPGIFAAGDVRTKQLRQIATAVADGANAVTSVERYLTKY
ncbi:MAG: FAD-dependent oxidoreductase [Lachnospiraceae bacterium]|jgi:thioredoxin reductase (NADPH)|nr:FAD-dependent oxidoreductase [Lachnospiraceae bacterium]